MCSRSMANALKHRGSLTIWFDPEMSWDAVPAGRRGRRQTYSGEEDQENSPGDCFPDERHPDVPVDEGAVRDGRHWERHCSERQ